MMGSGKFISLPHRKQTVSQSQIQTGLILRGINTVYCEYSKIICITHCVGKMHSLICYISCTYNDVDDNNDYYYIIIIVIVIIIIIIIIMAVQPFVGP
jgi:hypothetical protein